MLIELQTFFSDPTLLYNNKQFLMNNILREKKSYAFVTSLFTLLECELFEMPHQVILMSQANGCFLVMN